MQLDKTTSIGIISINLHSLYMNYGAALHSFAFQNYLKIKGYDSVILDYESKHFNHYNLKYPFIMALRRRYGLKQIIAHLIMSPSFFIKYRKFERFYKLNCKMIDYNGRPYYYEDFLKKGDNFKFEFDTAICESDVIWSPLTSHGFDRVFFCDFNCFNDKKKIAYSPSISNTKLNAEEENEFKKLIKNFDFISTREKETADYVQTLTDKTVTHVLDPVLLLDSDFYESYLKKPKYKNYLLVYNCTKNDSKMIRFAKKVAKKNNLKLIELSNFVRNKIDHKVITSAGIEEFWGLIANCSMFITNGFHGMCFAILFKKNFVIFERDGYDIKVKSLLETLDIKNAFIKHEMLNKDSIYERFPEINWNKVYTKLDDMRIVSNNFILSSLL